MPEVPVGGQYMIKLGTTTREMLGRAHLSLGGSRRETGRKETGHSDIERTETRRKETVRKEMGGKTNG